MSKNLVIVESPAKARTINKYLGKDFVVKASMGHVRDLPKGTLGIDVEHDFEPRYIVIRNRNETIKELKKIAKASEMVFLAPDPDREGEAIAWHLTKALELPEQKVRRITFNEITKRAVQESLKNPGRIDDHKVEAQQARRVLDRLVGYKLSPLLWEKIARGLSAGRVQSAAVRLIVEREREVRAFVPEEYWKILARLRKQGAPKARDPERDPAAFEAELKRKDGQTLDLTDEAGASAAFADLEHASYRVSSVEKKKKSLKAPPPFSTSLLQQQASTRLRFSAKKTMMVAQQLYEGVDIGGSDGQVGLITYMRTDSYRLADEALGSIRGYIALTFGERYLPQSPNRYHARKGAQEAHEAIRPTDVARTPESLKNQLKRDQWRLYKLIWERVVACQMANAEYDQTSVTIDAGKYQLAARGRVLTFDGHLRVYAPERAEPGTEDQPEAEHAPRSDEQALPPLVEGEPLDLVKLDKSQHFTQPPARYSEATLVKTLEKNGIGRPSTYATIISTIQDRGYVNLQERKFFATELGEVVNDALVGHFPGIVDLEFTAGIESKLDLIEEDKADWLKVVRDFYDVFAADLDKAQERMANLKSQPAPSGEKCPECGKEMLLRFNRYGRFLGCSGYPECKRIQRIGKDGKAEEPRPEPQKTDETCEKCGEPMVIREGRRGRFMACSAWPKCKNTFSVDDEGRPIKPLVTEYKCPKCESPMVVRNSKRGPFLGCTKYPKCRGTRQLPPDLPADLREAIAKRFAKEPAAVGDEPES
jgi:DNA topoisomerase-1